MKSLKHKLFNWIMPKLPYNSREQMFRNIGETLGVKTFTCEGELGLFEGSLRDHIVHGQYLKNGTWALWLQNILRDLIFKNNTGTFVDIGANIGLTSIPVARAKDIKCIAFEPEKSNYILLKKNIAANDLDSKIISHNYALFSEEGELEFELSEDNMGDHRVRNTSINNKNYYNESLRKTIKVKAHKLDNILKAEDLKKPLVVKLDVQGSEVRVLEGGKDFFKHVDFLFVEYWPYGITRMGDAPNAFIDFVKQFSWGAPYDDTSLSFNLELQPIDSIVRLLKSKAEESNASHLDLVLCNKKPDV